MKNFKVFAEVFDTEINSLNYVKKNLDAKNIDEIINFLFNVKGKIIVSAIGKSAHIGKKISATLSSVGTESFFLHATEAFHGDLGVINTNDVLLLISYSGETDEVLKVLNYAKKNKIKSLSITGNKLSSLAKNTDYHICSKIIQEACILNLAPTSSTTATLLIGDAISVSLMSLKNFKKENFAKYHPGGSLGRRLLTNVGDITQTKNLPLIDENISIADLIYTISNSGFGIGVCVQNNNIIGIVTDGDIRRVISQFNEINQIKVDKILNKNFKYIYEKSSLEEAKEVMQLNKILTLPVIDNNKKFIGLIQYYDL